MLQLPIALNNNDNSYDRPLINRKRAKLSISTASDLCSPPRSPYISSRPLPSASPLATSYSIPNSINSDSLQDVLAKGDVVGQGFPLLGESIRLVSKNASITQNEEPADEFEVIKQLGTGSYAVVYLVQEVLSRPPPSEDGHMFGSMEFDNKPAPSVVYGRKYAIKCLSKVNLDQDALAIQMTEVTIQQSLRLHPNIVTLYRTFETSAFLLLLLEYVPGEDLFYFLEQARDHYDTDTTVSTSHTPPTPSLLSNLHPAQLLSRTRLRLIASMFAQMCDAVAACHAQQVFHRDIKPENFIVTDGLALSSNGNSERRVVVKLTDFGLSTSDIESSDMDCGSAPYMSYECRNNVAPTYRPRAADVWSLGIVLINMLYHHNPWTDTAQGACNSFDLFRRDPVNFFMHRFTGMTKPVADTLATRVFCVLDDPQDDSPRMSASEFGTWARNLPTLLGSHGVHRTVSTSSTQGHRLSISIPISHRPSSRQASVAGSAVRTPAIPARSLSRAPSLQPTFEREEIPGAYPEGDHEAEGTQSRSTSTHKRRKRGARKGKGSAVTSPATPQEETLVTLAVASQSLVRELSMASKSSSHRSSNASPPSRIRKPFEPVSMYAMPAALLTSSRPSTIAPPPTDASPVAKKSSIWKLSFGKSSGASALSAAGPVDEPVEVPAAMSTTASNVTKLIMGLNAPPAPPDASWAPRGRQAKDMPPPHPSVKNHSRSPGYSLSTSPPTSWPRAVSPNSTRSKPVGSSASSLVSSNWRSSMSTTSSAGTSTSAFTRYSNSSARSVSTAATSVSSASWRATSVKPSSTSTHSISGSSHYSQNNIPKNIKLMDGVPWELDQLPRGQHPNPVGDIFGSPPIRKARTRKPAGPKDHNMLDTINERPYPPSPIVSLPPPTPTAAPIIERPRQDASTSTTDLGGFVGKDEMEGGVKKVQKGQITALAKMLSALRR